MTRVGGSGGQQHGARLFVILRKFVFFITNYGCEVELIASEIGGVPLFVSAFRPGPASNGSVVKIGISLFYRFEMIFPDFACAVSER